MSLNKSKSFTIIICTILLVLFNIWYIAILIIETIYIYKYIYDSRIIYLALIIFLSLIIINVNANRAISNVCIIKEIKNNSHIADCSGNAILYGLGDDVNLRDKIKISGKFKKLESNYTFTNSSINYYKSIDTSSYMNVKSYEIIEKSEHISSKIYKRSKNNELYIKYLYNIGDDFFLSVGIQYITILSITNKILSDFVSDKSKRLINICICLLLCTLIFPSMVLIRLIISNIIYLIFNSKCKYYKSTLVFILLFILFPNYLYSISFAYYFIFKVLALFYSSIPSKIKTFFCISYMNLYYFNEIIPIRIMLFSYLRYFYCFNYIIVILSLMLGHNFINLFDGILIYILSMCDSIIILGSINQAGLIIVSSMVFYCFNYYTNKKLSLLIFSIALIPYIPIFKPYYDIYYVNVGQGDSIIINSPFNMHTMVIDNPSNSKETCKTLKALGITTIDELVITHDDSDHSGGKDMLIDNFKVLNIHEDKTKAIKTRTYEVKLLLQDIEYSDKNKNSTIMYLTLNDKSYLFTGDIDIEVEKDLIKYYPNLKVDVLKVAHHGSKTSTSKEFISHVLPKLAIISVKKDNVYAHPSQEVIRNLHAYNTKILLTSENGTINIKSFVFISYFVTSLKQIGLL